MAEAEKKPQSLVVLLPNLPYAQVPEGRTAEDNVGLLAVDPDGGDRSGDAEGVETGQQVVKTYGLARILLQTYNREAAVVAKVFYKRHFGCKDTIFFAKLNNIRIFAVTHEN